LQASLEFVYYYYCVGQDKLGDKHLYDSLRIANNLGLFRQSSSDTARRDSLEAKTEKVRAVTAWCVFDLMRYFMNRSLALSTCLHLLSINRLDMQLEPSTDPSFSVYHSFETWLEYLVHLSNYIYTSQIVLCVVQDAAATSEMPLPKEIWTLFKTFGGKG